MTSYYDPGGSRIGMPRMTRGVKVLFLINLGVFLINAILTGSLGEWIGVSTGNVFDWGGLGLLRLVGYQFVHSFEDAWHFLGNSVFLYFFGILVEERLGTRALYRLYLLAGLCGGLVYLAVAAIIGYPFPVVGASGAVYGIMVMGACLEPRREIHLVFITLELRFLAGVLVAVGVYQSFVQFVRPNLIGTAHSAHVGGALWGFLSFRYRGTFELGANRIRMAVERRKEESRQEKQAEMDRLLEKVHSEGLSSLTAAERKFMDRASAEMRRK